jgi:ABC-type uncharacterized transport system ATPase subunit
MPDDARPMTAVVMQGIDKRFGAVIADRGASLEVRPGEIHALVGENGAGKSTLMLILAGLLKPDAGRVEVEGRDVTGWSASDAIAAGIGMVHQHLMLVPSLTVADNVMLGREPRRGAVIDAERANADVRTLAGRFGWDVDPSKRVADLSIGGAQRVEIVKAVHRGARVLVLDEPTAVLTRPEVRDLWRVLRLLRDDGVAIVLITHRLDEVVEIAERVTVMRRGQTVARLTAGSTAASIALAMIGREVALDVPANVTSARTDASPALSVRELSVARQGRVAAVRTVTFDIAPGEVLGIAGVEGNGQRELVEAIAGLMRVASGRVELGGQDVTSLDTRRRAEAGLAYIPENRQEQGLVMDFSIGDDLVLREQWRFAAGWMLDRRRVLAHAESQMERFDIRPRNARTIVRWLSGGNQQKVVVARELGEAPVALLAAHPTRGVDVGAIEMIHARIREVCAAGTAVLLVSAELGELRALSDRIGVMYRGVLSAPLPRAEATEERLGALMTGATS